MIKLPKEINYAELYLTFKCNLGCDYCINKQSGLEGRGERTGEWWIKFLNNIDFGDVALTIGGGEPTTHPDFYKILEKTNVKKDLLTNLQFNVDEFITKAKPEWFSKSDNPSYKSIRASYHTSMDANDTIKKLVKLQNAGFKVGLFGLNHPINLQKNMEMAELARENKIYFFIKDFLGKWNKQLYGTYQYPKGLSGNIKPVKCRSNELIIAPDGNIHRCHRDLYHNENPININNLYKFKSCSNFGDCNPCDLKLKTNRFLQDGNCQVEIK